MTASTRFVATSCLALGSLSLGLSAQEKSTNRDGLDSVPRVVARAAHERVLEVTESWVLPDGSTSLTTNSIVELATGLHYRDERGEWMETQESFELVPGAARAWQGSHRVTLAANPNTFAAVQFRLPDGRLLSSHVHGIGWHDLATGKTVLLAGIQDSTGLLVSTNVVVYPDALQGAVSADLRYTYTRAGFEQDIVLREAPPAPETFGLSSDTTRLEVWTEFDEPLDVGVRSLNAATDNQANSSAENSEGADIELDFGSARIGTGRYFYLGGEQESLGLMVKEWVQEPDGRRFLVEAVSVLKLGDSLDVLPPGPDGADARSVTAPSRGAMWAKAARPVRRDGDTAPFQVLDPERDTARVERLGRPGLVLDYLLLVSGTTNQLFRSDVMYWVTGTAILHGTTTFEAGACVKFDTSTAASIEVQGSLDWRANALMPVTLTARDDSGFGETAPGQTTPRVHAGYAGSGLRINGPTTTSINGLRVRNLRRGVEYATGTGHTLRHAQFVDVGEAIRMTTGTTVAARNILVARASTGVFGGTGSATAQVEHATIDGANRLAVSGVFTSNSNLVIRNSILHQFTNSPAGTYTGGSHTVLLNYTADLFASLRGGSRYLPPNSPHRDAGTATVDSTLTTELREMTTDVPRELVGEIAFNTVLNPIVPVDTGTLDRGYHYPRIDYAASAVSLTNAVLTLTNGVRLATYGTVGIHLRTGAAFRSGGSPNRPNHLSRLALIQEETTAETTATILASQGGTTMPSIHLRFTDFAAAAETSTRRNLATAVGNSLVVWTMRDCRLHNPYFTTYAYSSGQTLTWQNNIWHRASISFYQPDFVGYAGTTWQAHNNLWLAGTISLDSSLGGFWTLRDNLFDGSANQLPGGTSWTASHNGYRGATSFGGGSNRTLTAADYQSGNFGTNYYPTTGTNLFTLVNVGSRTSPAAGLYHHTVRTDSIREETTTVDIGFHYLALSGGQLFDTDGDGIPDWVEDLNGDGSATGDPTSWTSYNSGNSVGVGSVILFSPLK